MKNMQDIIDGLTELVKDMTPDASNPTTGKHTARIMNRKKNVIRLLVEAQKKVEEAQIAYLHAWSDE